MSEWQPIETAPKDGTPVDLWCGEYQERLVNYSREDRGGGNVFYVPNESGRCVVRSATHWMPLPPPPDGT